MKPSTSSFVTLAVLAAFTSAACDAQTLQGRGEVTVGGKTVSEVFSDAPVRDLAVAACRGDGAGVAAALREGVDPNARGLDGVTPIFWALACDSLPGVEALLVGGADPNLMTEPPNPISAVDVAVTRDTRLLQAVLRHGGFPSPCAFEEAFGVGMDQRGWDNYYALLDAGTDINTECRGTVAEFAAALNQWDKVAELLERGYNTRLPYLGRLLQSANVQLMFPEQVEIMPRVRRMLEERGVRFPVSSEEAYPIGRE